MLAARASVPSCQLFYTHAPGTALNCLIKPSLFLATGFMGAPHNKPPARFTGSLVTSNVAGALGVAFTG